MYRFLLTRSLKIGSIEFGMYFRSERTSRVRCDYLRIGIHGYHGGTARDSFSRQLPIRSGGIFFLYPSARYRNCSVMIDLVIIGCQYKRNQEGRICFKGGFLRLIPKQSERGAELLFFVSATDRESQHGLPDRMDWSASQVRTGTGNVHSGVPCRQPIQKPGAGTLG